MTWQDRPYNDGGYGGMGGRPEIRLQFPKISSAVMWLLVINVAIHFVNVALWGLAHIDLAAVFGLELNDLKRGFIWQPITYMFIHSTGSMWHLLGNMLGLYIFGSELERTIGTRRFLKFYGLCGLVGGFAYLALSLIAPRFAGIDLVGASGAIYGLLIAAIIFFPHMRIILIIFPVPVRVFGMIILAGLLLNALSGNMTNVGGEICHMGGALTGIGIFYAWGMMPRIRFGSGQGPSFAERRQQGAWERKQRKLAELETEADKILEKVHAQGMQSLTRKERKTLESATRSRQERENRAGRIDQL